MPIHPDTLVELPQGFPSVEAVQAANVDQLIKWMLPSALIFADAEEHLQHARKLARVLWDRRFPE